MDLRCITALEQAVSVLQKECENIQVVKASTSKLETKSLPEPEAKKLLYVQLFKCTSTV